MKLWCFVSHKGDEGSKKNLGELSMNLVYANMIKKNDLKAPWEMYNISIELTQL